MNWTQRHTWKFADPPYAEGTYIYIDEIHYVVKDFITERRTIDYAFRGAPVITYERVYRLAPANLWERLKLLYRKVTA